MTLLPVLTSLVLLDAGQLSIQYEGPLKSALKEIAVKGHINVVVAGDLAEPVQVSLTDVTAEEALETVAKVYGLEITRQGKLWILRERRVAPTAAAAPTPTPAVTPSADAPGPAPRPPDPPEAEADTGDEAMSAAQSAQEAAEKLREEAEAAREHAEELRDQAHELAAAKKDKAQALREMAKARAEMNKVSTGGAVHVEAATRVDSAIAYGGPVIVEPDAVVEGDAVAFGGDVELKANAVVEGDAVAFGGKVIKGPNAVVKGETLSMGGDMLGSAISGAVANHERSKGRHKEIHEGSSSGKGVAGFLVKFALLFGLGFGLMMFAPDRLKAIEATIRAEPAKNGLAGFLGLLAAIPATVLLVLTLVGIPVAVLLWLAVSLVVPVGLAAVAHVLGRSLPTGPLRRTQALILALGVVTLLLVGTIPVLGPLALSIAVLVSLGAIVRTRFGQPGRGTPILESEPAAASL